MSHAHQTAAQIRRQLPHPIIDADGHWIEFGPYVRDELRRIGGDKAVEGYSLFPSLMEQNLAMPVPDRRTRRIAQGPWWTQPTRNTRDRATVMMPAMLASRMEELGFDFMVLYPSAGNSLIRIPDDDTRRRTCRAFNTFTSEFFGPYADRMTPAAMIPMHTPEEAIAELEFAVRQLGAKVVCLASLIPRSITQSPAGVGGSFPELRGANASVWYDALALDSVYDYDPVWRKCIELGVSPTFHTGSRGLGPRVSPENFVYNHIGHFAAASEAVCKAMFIGGVTRRFPQMKVGFLEGGVGWACQLYADLIGHWEKRNIRGLEETDPKNIDKELLADLVRQFGGNKFAAAFQEPDAAYDTVMTPRGTLMSGGGANLDDFAACHIDSEDKIRDLFVDNFYFGCEADDPMNALAFNRALNPNDAQIRVLFGSDIGHFDVPDIAGVVPEAYELVEHGLIGTDDFRDFTFANAVRFYGQANPNFFKGTRVAAEAAALLAH